MKKDTGQRAQATLKHPLEQLLLSGRSVVELLTKNCGICFPGRISRKPTTQTGLKV